MFLDTETFRTVVASTPLVSIGLLVRNGNGQLLLGRRTNRPAQGCWFTPGGRICKNEGLDAAFRRISEAELGRRYERHQGQLLGVYEHFYKDSVFGEGPGHPDTHYVVLGYVMAVDSDHLLQLPAEQHVQYRWWPIVALGTSLHVHANTRAYLSALR
ncbi:MAG: GDP-mannose mannosyl hydrolase [Pseudomonas sp.]|nr:GDP-mannose mannosyl hydrolase [Pseudomonas sp.]RCL63280.1 MAG: GDP-mannose mannosyl hydrolase [Pseudomonas sp.]